MKKNIRQHVPVFVSSTYEDLIPHRAAVWETLEKLRLAVSGMEIFGARPEGPLETCLKEVSKCQYFVGILGMRYGSLDDVTGKSFVYREYEEAIEQSLEILIYLIDEEHATLKPKDVETGENADKLREFKGFLQRKHTTDTFSSPEDLATKVERDLVRLFSERGHVVEEERLEPTGEPGKTLELLQRFNLMPAGLAGSEIDLVVRFSGVSKPITRDTCNAIGLPVGNSIERDIEIVQPPNVPDSFYFAKSLYGQYSGCDFIYAASNDQAYQIIARLAYGEQKNLYLSTDRILGLPSSSHYMSFSLRGKESGIKDMETGETFDSYITHSSVKAMVFVKAIGAT